MGVFGIRIHQIGSGKDGADASGSLPFSFLGYGEENGSLRPMIKYDTGWKNARYLDLIERSAAPYLPANGSFNLASIFKVYDWVDDDGYNNFGEWVESAAEQAGL